MATTTDKAATLKTGEGLRRQLGVWSVVAIVVGEVIAVGIFLVPAEMAKSIGSPLWLLVVWTVMGGMALSGALCYGELAARFPEAGGSYVYLREVYGPRLAFLYGWKCFLVMDPGLTAALAVGLASYAGYMVRLSQAGVRIVAICAIILLAGLNMLGVKVGAELMRWLTIVKLGSLVFIVAWGFGRGLGDWSNFTPFVEQHSGSSPLVMALAGGMVSAFFAFGGWWEVARITGEVRDPARVMPRAMAIGVCLVTIVYVLTSAVFLYLVPIERVATGETFAAQAGEALFGRAGGDVFSMIVIFSVLGSLAGFIMVAPRIYYAMSRDGLFLKSAAAIHPRFGTPVRAIALQAALASLLVLVGTFDEILAYFIFITVVFIALTVAGVFVLRRRGGDSPFMTPAYPITPLIFLALVSALLVLLAAGRPQQALSGLAVVLVGLPVYHFAFHKRKRRG